MFSVANLPIPQQKNHITSGPKKCQIEERSCIGSMLISHKEYL